jgi:hypothetical protein
MIRLIICSQESEVKLLTPVAGDRQRLAVNDSNGDKLPDVIRSNKKGTFVFEQVRKKK